MSTVRPLIVGWKDLLRMGWPYSRAHTWRLMRDTITVCRKVKGEKRRVAEVLPNPDRFPSCMKLGSHRGSHPVWRVSEVLAYFEAHGLAVTQDWQAP
jgi:predicted DNA-binding transcriptional regulator AlpA